MEHVQPIGQTGVAVSDDKIDLQATAALAQQRSPQEYFGGLEFGAGADADGAVTQARKGHQTGAIGRVRDIEKRPGQRGIAAAGESGSVGFVFQE